MPGRERRSRRGQIYKRMMAGKVGENPKDVKKEDIKEEKPKVEKKKESTVEKVKKVFKKE